MGVVTPSGLAENLQRLGLDPDPTLIAEARGCLPPPAEAVKVDAEDLSPDALREVVARTPVITHNHAVTVWWPSEGVAVSRPTGVLIDGLDDWWYPAADDVVVTDGRRCLLIDHEETVTWW